MRENVYTRRREGRELNERTNRIGEMEEDTEEGCDEFGVVRSLCFVVNEGREEQRLKCSERESRPFGFRSGIILKSSSSSSSSRRRSA